MDDGAEESSSNVSRRSVLTLLGAAGAAGVAGALAEDGAGNIFGGTMALDQAYQAGDRLWIGPDSARTTVDARDGRIYIGASGNGYTLYNGDDGSWSKKGLGDSDHTIPSIVTESIGGDRRVGNGDTIQGAIDELTDGGRVVVTPNYDPTAESLPIQITDWPGIVCGPAALSSHTDAPGALDFSGVTADNVFDIEFTGTRVSNEMDMLVLEGLAIIGGNNGLRLVSGVSHSMFRDLYLLNQDSDGILVENGSNSQNSNTFSNVRVRGAGGNGCFINSGAAAHTTDFIGCTMTHCGNRGLRITGGKGCTVFGGNYGANGSYGIHLDDRANGVIGPYLEGNSDSDVADLNISADGCYVLGGRFQGLGSNDRAVNILAEGATVGLIQYIDYVSGAVTMSSDAVDTNILATTMYDLDGSGLIATDVGTRTRVDGIIGGGPLGGVDLSSTTGQIDGDLAVADGSSAASAGAWARWTAAASNWQYADPTGTI